MKLNLKTQPLRNKEITEKYLTTNLSLEEIAKMYGLTKQRIHQIVRKEQVKLAEGENNEN